MNTTAQKKKLVEAGLPEHIANQVEASFPNVDWQTLLAFLLQHGPGTAVLIEQLLIILGLLPKPPAA